MLFLFIFIIIIIGVVTGGGVELGLVGYVKLQQTQLLFLELSYLDKVLMLSLCSGSQ